NLPVIDGKNWSKWNVQIRALFGFQDVYEVIQNGVEEPKATTSDAQRQALKDLKKKDHNERVYDYLTRLLIIVNQMQECGEKFKDQDLVEKVMRTFTPRFDGRVVAIEEARDLSEMKIEELQASL
ncbi:hypothetical protein glysoja_021726, partial [Glycine soja]